MEVSAGGDGGGTPGILGPHGDPDIEGSADGGSMYDDTEEASINVIRTDVVPGPTDDEDLDPEGSGRRGNEDGEEDDEEEIDNN